MKNILVKSLFEVQDTNWNFRDRSDEQDLYNKYLEMHRISVGSYSQHLKGTWELKFIGGKVAHINQAFETTFREIHKIWSQGNVNILYTDPDTVAIRDFDPWNISDRFMMFNFTDPRSFDQPNRYERTFENFFNAGVRYFPAAMSPSTWNQGLEMVNNWDHSSYDTEQIILNSMLWDQGVKLHEVLMPNMAYQAHLLPDQAPLCVQDLWNGININHSIIIHTHSSRNIDSKLQLMKNLTKRKS
jgi:hypothetical protein